MGVGVVALIPHFQLPLRLLPTGSFAVVDQGTVEEIAQNVATILATPLGSRIEVPDFGIPDPTFVGASSAAVLAAVNEWEPRTQGILTVDVLQAVDATETLAAVTVAVRSLL